MVIDRKSAKDGDLHVGDRTALVTDCMRALDLPPGEHELVVRAWDSSAATQPEDEAALRDPVRRTFTLRQFARLAAAMRAVSSSVVPLAFTPRAFARACSAR